MPEVSKLQDWNKAVLNIADLFELYNSRKRIYSLICLICEQI